MSRFLYALLLLAASFAFAQERTLFRSPTVSSTHIVFVYAGDLWSVPRAGGEAVRLTSSPGIEANPLFSPDGSQVAFSGQYDGNTDVYVVPATGGVPKRLTFHPGPDVVQGWTPDSRRVLYTNVGSSHNNQPRLYTVDMDGSFPQPLPLPSGAAGSMSPDGARIAYLPIGRANEIWKNYRGGRATPIWIASLDDSRIVKIPRTDSNDYSPMWIGSKVYFLSDRSGHTTLFDFDPGTQKVTQLLESKALDIKSASAGGEAIVYERFGEIYLYDLKTHKESAVSIRLNGDLAGVRPRLEKTAKYIGSFDLSPSGARAVFEARGDVYTVPAEKGDIRNLTQTPGAADRGPAWSPDGKWIAYFSDESGEYAMYLRGQNGMGEVRKFALDKNPTFYYMPTWSPDSKKIAYLDKHFQLWMMDLEKKEPVLVAKRERNSAGSTGRPSWAPDSQWIAYPQELKTGLSAVFVYSLKSGKSTRITDGMSDAQYPAWDKNGKYLYFAASTDVGPTVQGLDLSNLSRSITRSLYVAVLKQSDPSPLAPESDEEKIAEDKPAEKKADETPDGDKKATAKKEAAPTVVVDLDGIDQRIVALPVPPRNYEDLMTGKTGILFYREVPVSMAASAGPASLILNRFELSKRKAEPFLTGVEGFTVSANGEKILLRMQQSQWILAGTAAAPKPGEGVLKLDGMETFVDPVAEWRQMFRETWRIERDWFYDAKHHGLDLQAASESYERYLKAVAHRADLNYLFSEMLGQLSVGHLFINGGDIGQQPNPVKGGLLGADYKIENGRYRFARVFSGESWNPQTRAPLTQPGVGVKTGEYLLAVNGRELRSSDNVYHAFEGTAGKSVVIKVGPNPSGEGSREVTVVPVEEENSLRTLAWVEDNRRKVDQLSGGKLAYIHLPDTATGGYTYFNRYYFAQTDKQGAVLDERFNRGGLAADYIIDHLRRPIWNYWVDREGDVFSTPGKIVVGPKVMLANEYSGSGGDLLPWLFKRAKLGPVIGKRTWGGLVGIGGYPPLIDGGRITAPHFAFFTAEGQWDVENHGTSPDIEIDLDPKAWREGRDTQLEKAVEVAMADLKKNPPVTPAIPAYPDYHKGTPLAPGQRTTSAAGQQ